MWLQIKGSRFGSIVVSRTRRTDTCLITLLPPIALLRCNNLGKCRALHKAITELCGILQRREVSAARQLSQQRLGVVNYLIDLGRLEETARGERQHTGPSNKSALPPWKRFVRENVRLICLFRDECDCVIIIISMENTQPAVTSSLATDLPPSLRFFTSGP